MITVELHSGGTMALPISDLADVPYFQGIADHMTDGRAAVRFEFDDAAVRCVLGVHSAARTGITPLMTAQQGMIALFADYIGSTLMIDMLPRYLDLAEDITHGDQFIIALVRGRKTDMMCASISLRFDLIRKTEMLVDNLRWLADLVKLPVTCEWVITQLVTPDMKSAIGGELLSMHALEMHVVYVYLAWDAIGSDVLHDLLLRVLQTIEHIPQCMAYLPRVRSVAPALPVRSSRVLTIDHVMTAWAALRA